MPVELSERELRDAIAVVGEWDREGAQAAQSAFEWMGWEGEEPLFLRRYDVQLFVWYVLPRKYLVGLDRKEAVAAALAKTLERLGGQAASYAEVCRAPETRRLLCAWEAEDPAAPRTFRKLLDGSGIEPPDTDLLAWGSVMGFEEARVREQVATALEEAIESGSLAPGSRGFARRQAEVAKAALREAWDGEDGRSRLRAVQDERLEGWLQRGPGGREDARRAILDGIAAMVSGEPPAIDPDGARSALEPTLWLLEQGNDGIGLTQTGALNRALVREVAERWPGWWEADLFGPPHREDDVTQLWELHQLLRELRLLRRKGRRVLTTKRGRELAGDPSALLEALATELLRGENFYAACAELAVALILDGAPADYGETLAARVQPAVAAAGWRAGEEPPSVRDVSWQIAAFLRPAEAIGVLVDEGSGSRLSRKPLVLTGAGRAALTAALRTRALAPAHSIRP
jgi:hypothetical protein